MDTEIDITARGRPKFHIEAKTIVVENKDNTVEEYLIQERRHEIKPDKVYSVSEKEPEYCTRIASNSTKSRYDVATQTYPLVFPEGYQMPQNLFVAADYISQQNLE